MQYLQGGLTRWLQLPLFYRFNLMNENIGLTIDLDN